MIYNYNDIKVVHLEVTDKCNASCPMCARNKNGGVVNQHLSLTELSLQDCKKIFPVSFIKQLDRMYMCGNNGDPVVATYTLAIFKYFREHNKNILLGMHTNGSARNQLWWKELAQIMGKKGYVTFGIDGLGDTHHLYRKGTDHARIMSNAKVFIGAGGRARWDFIVFAHNEHQIETARILATTNGFEQFRTKKTGRFFSNTMLTAKGSRDVINIDGSVSYVISPPKSPKYQNDSLQKEQEIIEAFGSMNEYLDQTPISCIVKEQNDVYISADGYVFPCCWTANQLYVWWKKLEEGEIWDHINNTGGIDSINAKLNTIKDIVSGSFFQNIEDSWSCSSIKKGKMAICSRVCGKKFNQFKDQYE